MMQAEPTGPIDLATTDIENLKPVTGLELEVRAHLRRVFFALTGATAFGAAGTAFFIFTGFPVILSLFITLGLVIYISATPELSNESSYSSGWKLAAFQVLGFFQGSAIGALVQQAIKIDPNIVVMAFIGTVVIFGCFAGSALYAKRRTYLYLGGYLMSCLLNLLVLSLANIFFHLRIIELIWLYGGLFLFCGFVLYDTNLIIEKAHQGSRDYVRHALGLFLDFVNIFVRLLIILSRRRD